MRKLVPVVLSLSAAAVAVFLTGESASAAEAGRMLQYGRLGRI